MFGVIIWSDPGASSAVIWCEEKSSLAYYDAERFENVPPESFFDTGDYVEFDLVDEDRRWMAVNARTIALTPTLPHRLSLELTETRKDPADDVPSGAEIIQFSDHRTPGETPRRGPLNRRG